jgi:hypothetical protein
MANGARFVVVAAVLFLGLPLPTDAEKCANNEDMLTSACACAAGFRVDEKRTWDGDGLWETVSKDCRRCPAGTFSAAGDALCAPCAVATYSDADAAVCTTDQFLASHAPGVFACAVIGLVGAVLNSLAIIVLFLWVKGLKSVVTQADAGAV